MAILTSRNYSPSASLRDIVARHYVFSAALPENATLIDSLLSETAFIRIIASGDWAAEAAPGQWESRSGALLFGANCRPFRVRVRGPFRVIGIALRPCGWRSLFDAPASCFVERLIPVASAWGDALGVALADVVQLQDDVDVIAACEALIESRINAMGGMKVDHPMRAFERIARCDSTMMVQEAARQVGLSERQLERRTLANFGHTPKAIMRRSRFLDMAAAMRGLGQPSDEVLAGLRYFDQSHLTREFRRFIGMSPRMFAQSNTPLLDAGLMLRDMRKAEATGSSRGGAPVVTPGYAGKPG
ncbi:AraC family transcriptional regulator [Sphingobium aquiterrae]|uniref:AraC family transcriptional regulator n=1 Tax=Sphingobium aquiterrae TaxID=2038656 RepID=UPI0030160884